MRGFSLLPVLPPAFPCEALSRGILCFFLVARRAVLQRFQMRILSETRSAPESVA